MAFVTTWTTTGVDETITIPCGDIGTYNATIDWGDASPDSTITTYNDADLAHTYAVADTYTVTITGTLPWVYFNNGGDRLKIKSIEEWGDVGILSGWRSFFGCTNLVSNATDTPDMSNVTFMDQMFDSCTNFNQALTGWDVSSVTGMDSMFRNCSSFNGDISGWDVGLVADMAFMFRGATLFNQDISGWDVSSVTAANFMFYLTSFNQDIGGWDVSSLVNMDSMFRGLSNFNQDLSSWDVSSVTNMNALFRDCTNFDQNLCSWDITSVTNMLNMFYGVTLSIANYDRTLIGWEAQSVQNSINVHFGSSVYCFGATARAALIADHTWTITDGGVDAGPCVDPGPCDSADFHMYKTDRIADGVGPVEASQLQGVLVR